MSFDHPDIVIFGHHPLGARTRYLLLCLLALPLLIVFPDDPGERAWDIVKRDMRELRGKP